MKTKSKTPLLLQLPKPRNPVALQAKARRAGAHDGGQPARLARRNAKHALQQLLAGRTPVDE